MGFIFILGNFCSEGFSLDTFQEISFGGVELGSGVTSGVDVNVSSSAFVNALINLCHGCGRFVLAGQVYTERQSIVLSALQCAYMKGPYFSPALTYKDVVSF